MMLKKRHFSLSSCKVEKSHSKLPEISANHQYTFTESNYERLEDIMFSFLMCCNKPSLLSHYNVGSPFSLSEYDERIVWSQGAASLLPLGDRQGSSSLPTLFKALLLRSGEQSHRSARHYITQITVSTSRL